MKVRNRKNKLQYKTKVGQLKCTCCGVHYKSLWCVLDQASECSSIIWLYDNTIHSNYGSKFDTSKFKIINPSIIKEQHHIYYNNRDLIKSENKYGEYDYSGLITCDSCIQKYLDKGFIVEDKTYNYWQPIEQLNKFYESNPKKYMIYMVEHGLNALNVMKQEEENGLWLK